MTLGLVPISTLLCIFIRFSYSFVWFKRGHLSCSLNLYALRACSLRPSCHVLSDMLIKLCWVLRESASILIYKFPVHYIYEIRYLPGFKFSLVFFRFSFGVRLTANKIASISRDKLEIEANAVIYIRTSKSLKWGSLRAQATQAGHVRNLN